MGEKVALTHVPIIWESHEPAAIPPAGIAEADILRTVDVGVWNERSDGVVPTKMIQVCEMMSGRAIETIIPGTETLTDRA